MVRDRSLMQFPPADRLTFMCQRVYRASGKLPMCLTRTAATRSASMGFFLDGVWQQDAQRTDKSGAFQRPTTTFRHHITADGSAGPTGERGFPAEAGRYH